MYQSFLECYFPIKLIKTFSFLEVSCNLNVIQLTLSRYAKNLPALLQITVEQSSVEQTKGENSFDLAIRKKYEFFFFLECISVCLILPFFSILPFFPN